MKSNISRRMAPAWLMMTAVMGIFFACNSDKKTFSNATELIGEKTPVSSFKLAKNKAGKVFGTMELRQDDHTGFDTALIVTCDRLTIMDWDLLVTCPVNQKLGKGDIVYLEFYGKYLKPKPETNIGQVLFEFPSMYFPVVLDTAWHQYATYAVIAQDTDPTDLRIHCSFEPQSIALGGIRMYRFGPEQDISQFRNLTPLYESDGKWENASDRRIDSLRKAMAEFVLKDEMGNPLTGLDYNVEMIKHAFRFGTAIDPNLIIGKSPDAEKYGTILKQDFNHVVFENHFKWIKWKNETEREHAFEALDWLEQNNFTVRGHTLVWPWFDFPWKLIELNYDTLQLKKDIVEHLSEKANALNGRLVEWDVLNEPFVVRDKPYNDNTGIWLYREIFDVVGLDEVVKWYKTAHAISPNIPLFINDYDIIADGGHFELHKNDLERLISMLLQNGAPVGGIGFQGHFEGYLTRPERVYQIIDRFSQFGLPILITEFDAIVSNGHDEEAYRFTHDLLKICFSHPGIDGFLNWGFWAGSHWRPNTAFYDSEWNLRPGGKAWKDLIYNEWWTRTSGKTDTGGRVSFRGFMGDYKITYAQNGVKTERHFRLNEEGIIWL